MITTHDWCQRHGHQNFFHTADGICCPICFSDDYQFLVDVDAEQQAEEIQAIPSFAMNTGD